MDIQEQIRFWFIKGCHFTNGIDLLRSLKVENDFIELLIEVNQNNPIAANKTIKETIRAFGTYQNNTSVDTDNFKLVLKAANHIPTTRQEEGAPSPDHIPSPAPVPSPAYKPTSPQTPKGYKLLNNNDPLNIKLLRAKSIGLLKERALLHELMRQEAEAGESKKAYILARKILYVLTPEIGIIYKKIRAWEESIVEPDAPLSNEFKKGVETALKKESLRTRIAKLKRLLKGKLPLPKKQEYEKELSDKKVELEKISKLLSDM